VRQTRLPSGWSPQLPGVQLYAGRDETKVGEGMLFYHSSANLTAVMGTARIVRAAYPNHTAWDPKSRCDDAKRSPDNPIWLMVGIKAGKEFGRPVTLQEIKGNSKLQRIRL
jgi:predicted RNA-binding protein with PUA-like domain